MAVSDDGGTALALTTESLVASDDDGGWPDYYLLRAGSIEMVRDQTTGLSTTETPQLKRLSPDGSTVVFTTEDALTQTDDDDYEDLYSYRDGRIELLTDGPNVSGDSAEFRSQAWVCGISDDGTRVIFTAEAPIGPTDDDRTFDVYAYENGALEHLSVPAAGVESWAPNARAVCTDVAEDMERVAFFTADRMTADDTDDEDDNYERYQGTTSFLADLGWAGINDGYKGEYSDGGRRFTYFREFDLFQAIEGRGTIRLADLEDEDYAWGSSLLHVSEDGLRVKFLTDLKADPSVESELDFDLYEAREDGLSLISPRAEVGPGPGLGAADLTDDGREFIFRTSAALDPTDTDEESDLYTRRNLEDSVLLSTGYDPSLGRPYLAGNKPFYLDDDGSRGFFPVDGPEDGYDDAELIAWSADGSRSRVPFLPTNDLKTNIIGDWIKTRKWLSSADMTCLYFFSSDRLTDEDQDDRLDLYSATSGDSDPESGCVRERPTEPEPADPVDEDPTEPNGGGADGESGEGPGEEPEDGEGGNGAPVDTQPDPPTGTDPATDPGNPALDQKLEGFRIFSRNPQRYRRGRVAGSVRAEEEALLAVRGAVKVGSRKIKLKRSSLVIGPQKEKFSTRARKRLGQRRIVKKLRAGRRLEVKLVARARDRAGNAETVVRKLTLRR